MLPAMNFVTLLGIPRHTITREAPITIESTAIPSISTGVMSLERIEKETTIMIFVAMFWTKKCKMPLATRTANDRSDRPITPFHLP
jgi:hypothetical protein